jgi:hypothetical protein
MLSGMAVLRKKHEKRAGAHITPAIQREALSAKQCVKLAAGFQFVKIVATADMLLANENLWNCHASACPLHKLFALCSVKTDVHFFKSGAFFVEQPFGRNAIRANFGRVHRYRRHSAYPWIVAIAMKWGKAAADAMV